MSACPRAWPLCSLLLVSGEPSLPKRAPFSSFHQRLARPLYLFFVLFCTSHGHLALAPGATAVAPVCLSVSPTLDNGGIGAAREGWVAQPYRPPSYLHPGPSISGACALVCVSVCVGAREPVRFVRVSSCVNRTGRGYGCANVILCGCGMVLIDAAFLRDRRGFLTFPVACVWGWA